MVDAPRPVYMHTQIHPLKSVRISIPKELNNRSFVFRKYFALGDAKTTNLSERLGDFDEAFFDNAKYKCQMPQQFCFIDVPTHKVDTFQQNTKIADPWDFRLPIKLVGRIKSKQLKGEDGPLLVDGNSNIFICRDCHNNLKMVELYFYQSTQSWKISSADFNLGHVLEGPCRIFLACR
jgi:hypothetical protein